MVIKTRNLFYLLSISALVIALNFSCGKEQPDTQAPTAPTDLIVASTSTNSVTLSWTASTDNVGVSGYKIFRNGNEVGKSVSASYTDLNLIPFTTYTYFVKAFDAVGNISKQSQTVEAKTLDDCPACSKWLVETPSFVSPTGIGVITAGESKSAGVLALKNSSSASHTANLTLTFSGVGASAVDSLIYKVGSTSFRKKVENNVVVLDNVSVPANTSVNVEMIYKIKSPIPAGVADQSQITLAFTSLTTDEAGVTQAGSKTLPGVVNLDKLYVPKLSVYIGDIKVEYKDAFAIIGNAVSNELTITINNTATVNKTLTSLTANFGANGSAVKMLRYLDANGKWVVLKANNGEITFSNLVLKPGVNTIKTYFALKPQVGVANGSTLAFSFTKLDDGAGGQVPAIGKFQSTLNVGTVNANTQATVVTSEWLGYMSQATLTLSPTAIGFASFYSVTYLTFVGPGDIKIKSLGFRNPYYKFMGKTLDFNNSEWRLFFDGPPMFFLTENIIKDGNLINFANMEVFPSLKLAIYNSLLIGTVVNNPSATEEFFSGDITPLTFGLELVSKYDIVLLNSNGQVIDMSDVVVKQGQKVLEN